MLEAVPKNFFSWDFTVYDGARPVAVIDTSWWRDRGRFDLDGRTYRVYREGLVRGAFILEEEGKVLARAHKPSAFRRLFLVAQGEKKYTLRARRALGRAFVLFEGPVEVGSLTPKGFFTRRMTADLPADLPLPVRLFLIWLVLILWRREAESSSAAT